jgi:hypothetical protein
VFINEPNSMISLPSYSSIGSYISTIVAYDSIQQELIKSYSILSQPLYLNQQQFFKIDAQTGVLTLNNFIDLTAVQTSVSKSLINTSIIIVAANLNGLTSQLVINIDLSDFINTYYSRIRFPSMVLYIIFNLKSIKT